MFLDGELREDIALTNNTSRIGKTRCDRIPTEAHDQCHTVHITSYKWLQLATNGQRAPRQDSANEHQAPTASSGMLCPRRCRRSIDDPRSSLDL